MCAEKREKPCLNCGVGITRPNAKFCSRKCKGEYRNKIDIEKICENCGATFLGNYRKKACSKECMTALRKKGYKETCMEKYGVDNVSKTELAQQKRKETMVMKYGVEHPSQSKELLNRQRQLFVEKYGVDNPMKNKDVHDKWTDTVVDKFGGVAPILNKNIRDKYESTMVSKYGVANPYLSEEIKNKSKQTMIDKYGVPYYCLTEDCQKGTRTISKVNLAFNENLQKLGFNTQLEFVIQNRSYDIKVGNTLIEINPFPYHNSTRNPLGNPKDKNYHYDKLKLARDNGYRCIMIWDWDDLAKIPYLLDDNKQQLYARKCEVKQITYDDCHEFFEAYHLQGDTKKNKNNIYIGLYYNDELVECMSFGKPRYNKNYEWEILRLCSHKDYRVVGGANKIFKFFLEITDASSVISYCDMSKFDGKVYEQLGFNLLKWNKPSKHWYSHVEDDAKKHITDNFLRQRGYDQIFGESYGKGTNNDELMRERGYVEIYDCGQSTFVWTKG